MKVDTRNLDKGLILIALYNNAIRTLYRVAVENHGFGASSSKYTYSDALPEKVVDALLLAAKQPKPYVFDEIALGRVSVLVPVNLSNDAEFESDSYDELYGENSAETAISTLRQRRSLQLIKDEMAEQASSGASSTPMSFFSRMSSPSTSASSSRAPTPTNTMLSPASFARSLSAKLSFRKSPAPSVDLTQSPPPMILDVSSATMDVDNGNIAKPLARKPSTKWLSFKKS